MLLAGKKVGFVLTGAFAAFERIIPQIEKLKNEGAEILPIMSFNSFRLDTKFGKAQDFVQRLEEITGNKAINTIEEAEIIGVKRLTDIMIVAPCSR